MRGPHTAFREAESRGHSWQAEQATAICPSPPSLLNTCPGPPLCTHAPTLDHPSSFDPMSPASPALLQSLAQIFYDIPITNLRPDSVYSESIS